MAKRKKTISKAKIEYAQKNYTWQIITALFLVIAISSIYILNNKPNNNVNDPYSNNPNVTDIIRDNNEVIAYKYNNFEFAKDNGIWYTQVEKHNTPYVIAFKYDPVNLEDIKIQYEENLFPILTKPYSKVYVTFDHDTSQAPYIATSSINLISNMKSVWYINVSRACSINSSSCIGVDVVTCDSAPNNAVIEYVESNVTSIKYFDNCLRIEASYDEFIRAADKIILDWYDII